MNPTSYQTAPSRILEVPTSWRPVCVRDVFFFADWYPRTEFSQETRRAFQYERMSSTAISAEYGQCHCRSRSLVIDLCCCRRLWWWRRRNSNPRWLVANQLDLPLSYVPFVLKLQSVFGSGAMRPEVARRRISRDGGLKRRPTPIPTHNHLSASRAELVTVHLSEPFVNAHCGTPRHTDAHHEVL